MPGILGSLTIQVSLGDGRQPLLGGGILNGFISPHPREVVPLGDEFVRLAREVDMLSLD